MKYFVPHDSIDCGPACLQMISSHFGREYSLQYLRNICGLSRLGVSIYNLAKGAETLGLKATTAQLTSVYLIEKATLPCILYWDKSHFVVLYKIKKGKQPYFYIADPGQGKVKVDEATLRKYWQNDGNDGFALFLEPTESFKTSTEDSRFSDDSKSRKRSAISFLSKYFLQFKTNYLQVLFAMAVTAIASFLFPFLTQAIVDSGIKLKDLSFVKLILGFQLFLFLTTTVSDFIRSHLMLHITSRINISILGDFMSKMMRLPVKFFETKISGDLIQRIQDHTVVEDFISSTLLTTLFTLINLIVYSCILFYYNEVVFAVFIICSFMSIIWTLLFMKWRKTLNYLRFRELSSTNEKLFEMVNNMPEIKLNSFEHYKQQEWEGIRIKLFRLDISKLTLEQYQRIGSECFDQIKTILIIYFSVSSVITGDLTLGMMLAISYITGQLNTPIKEIVRFINVYQSASIGLERMNEVYTEKNEEEDQAQTSITSASSFRGIEVQNIQFGYLGPHHEPAIKGLTFQIPEGKVVAIVGSSGSGKTTLLKLLLRYYNPESGLILLNGKPLNSYGLEWWRSQIGVVMQEGHIFSDTIRRNIIMGDEHYNKEQLINAVELANLEELILDLPMHFDTVVGESGLGMSTGQKQRVLIARAIYKNPSFLFFDEATSSLDATNEKIIMENLQQYCSGKTVLIIAHRLSTVKRADQIIVLEKGRIVETGNHFDLVREKGRYYELIKNQLELDGE